MYAVIETGGKQYRVDEGLRLRVELLSTEVGNTHVIDRVLAVGNDQGGLTVGDPLIKGASVKAKVLAHGRGEKLRIFKLRRRKHSKRTQGHRQGYTELQIEAIKT